jgi:hypothetical protein
MKLRAAVLTICLISPAAWAQKKPLKLTPTMPAPGEQKLQRTLRQAHDSNEQQVLLCTVRGKNYAATSEDEGKCTEMGGTLRPGVDNSAGNIKYVPVMPPSANKANNFDRPRPGPHDKSDPLETDN